jgi:eukaryotic-like serine/threonine-protein kinase
MSVGSKDRGDRVETLFSQAFEIDDANTREEFLSTECADDAELKAEVETLLAAAEGADNYFAGLAGRLGLPTGDLDEDGEGVLGQMVGPYRLEALIGEGGMARVYLAERDDGEFRRKVALKVVKFGHHTQEVIARFRHERQILASLDHPYVARLHDGGVTDDGRPYLVMEYIDGKRITDHCRDAKLSFSDRVTLFLDVCAAVRDAHRALIVHRDLKPSNILVTEDGSPKLLDFGIAKILTTEHDPEAPLTRTDMRVLTPEYAAPEQLRGLPVTTQTDIYGLGMVLYELLANRRPFDLSGLAPGEAERVLLTQEPDLPSKFGGGAGRIAKDLDAVALKALEKATQDRYGSVEALMDDLTAALEGRQMTAKHMGPTERATRYLRRNWIASSVAAAFVVTLTGWSVSSSLQRSRLEEALDVAESERTAAVEERAVAEGVTDFVENLFRSANAMRESPGRRDTLPVSVFLDDAVERVHEDLGEQPAVQARLLGLLGSYNRGLGNYEAAMELLDESLTSQRAIHGGDHPDVATALRKLGSMYLSMGRPAEGEPILREALEMRRRLTEGDDAGLASEMSNLASTLQNQGRLDEARPIYDSAIAMAERLVVPDSAALLTMYNARGVLAFRLQDMDTALEIFEKLVRLQRARLDPGHPSLGREIQNLAFLKLRQGDDEGALEGFEEAMSILEPAIGSAHPEVAATRGNLARALFRVGRVEDAEREFTRSIQDRRSAGLGESPPTANTLGHYGSMKLELGEVEEALALFSEALGINEKTFGPVHPAVGTLSAQRGRALCRLGRLDEGRAAYESAITVLETVFPPDDPRTESARTDMAEECDSGAPEGVPAGR